VALDFFQYLVELEGIMAVKHAEQFGPPLPDKKKLKSGDPEAWKQWGKNAGILGSWLDIRN
jgi:hypothetical protein